MGTGMRKLNPKYIEAVKPLVNRSPYFTLLSMSLSDIGMGSSLLDIDVENKHLQPFGAVHGGVFASILDAAAFWAVFSEVDENVGMTTVDLKVNYLAPVQGGKLIASGMRSHFIGYYVLVMGLQGRPWNDCQGAEKQALRQRFDALKAAQKPAGAPDSGIERILDEIGVVEAARR